MVDPALADIVAATGGLGGVAALVSSFSTARTAKKNSSAATISGQANHAQIETMGKEIKMLSQQIRLLASAMDSSANLMRDLIRKQEEEIDVLKHRIEKKTRR